MNSVFLTEALQWLLKGIRWNVPLRAECSWTIPWLVRAALLWAWSGESTLARRFQCAQRLIRHLQGEAAKAEASWQAFIELLARVSPRLIETLRQAFQERMPREFADHWTLCGFVVFGVDGSPIAVARTQSNEDAFSTKKTPGKRDRRKKWGDPGADKRAAAPQILLTSLFHVGLHLLWDWRIGSRNDSERGHLQEMLDDLPADSLITGDAGFVGYDLARAILSGGRHMVIRVGSNVTLLKKLGVFKESHNTVYLWPDKTARRKSLPPLVFRLVVMQGPRHPVFLLTNILDTRRLSESDVITIYKARWSIEVYHRHLKQTFGRRKMLSHKAEHTRVELDWSVTGLWCMSLSATREFLEHGVAVDRMSMAGVLHSFRDIARDYLHPADRGCTLRIRLRRSQIDNYPRQNKSARSYSRRKKHKSAGAPVIEAATKEERKTARAITKAQNPYP